VGSDWSRNTPFGKRFCSDARLLLASNFFYYSYYYFNYARPLRCFLLILSANKINCEAVKTPRIVHLVTKRGTIKSASNSLTHTAIN